MRPLLFLNPVLLAVAILATGCARKTGEFGGRTAVVIKGRTPAEISEMIITVFREQGFEVKASSRSEVVVERQGGAWQELTWGSWMGEGVWERANVRITDYGGGSYLVEAGVKLIRDRDDEFFEDSQRMTRRARKPYQEWLNEVQARLQGPPA